MLNMTNGNHDPSPGNLSIQPSGGCMYVCVYTCMCVCVCVYVHVCITYVCVCVSVCMYKYTMFNLTHGNQDPSESCIYDRELIHALALLIPNDTYIQTYTHVVFT